MEFEKSAHLKECLIKVRFKLVADDSNQPLLTCGRCSEVVVKAGLTVYLFWFEKMISKNIFIENVFIKKHNLKKKILTKNSKLT